MMDTGTPIDDATDGRADNPVERLLEDSWEARSDRAGRRELIVEASAAALFLAAAIPAAIVGLRSASIDILMAAMLVVLYAIVSRTVKFPIGAGHFVPSYLVLVPMLVLLPPLTVPLLAALALVLGALGRKLAQGGPLDALLISVPDAWHAFGPAIVLALAPRAHGVALAAIYVAALCAGGIVDLIQSTAREWVILRVAPRLQIRVIASVWMIDACIAPVGLLLADAARAHPLELLVLAPLNVLLVLADRDRTARISDAQRRLALVGRQRSRLQAAVHRLGEAFAAKLDLGALTDVLLNGSIDAVDAGAGQLTLTAPSIEPIGTTAGDGHFGPLLEDAGSRARSTGQPVQREAGGEWALAVPLRLGADGLGALTVARSGREFSVDERVLLVELVSRAEAAAAEIIAHDLLREQAMTDPLTRLGNRRKLAAELASRLEAASHERPLVLMLFDLDGFKTYNDTFGHLAGDALLARLGQQLRAAVSPRGSAFRLGGDEFCALLPAVDDLDQVAGAAVRALEVRSDSFSITVSCGSVLLPHETSTVDYALQLADKRMYGKKNARRMGAGEQAHDVLINIMYAKEGALQDHSTGVARHALRVGRQLAMDAEQLDELGRAAELHDIGKVAIPDAILSKPGPLDVDEWEFIRQHTVLGDRILSAAPALRPVARIVRASHERWDGSGYPDGLSGDAIPLAARIIAVCDAYEAILADRSYRPGRSSEIACEELRRGAGRQFDPLVVASFLDELQLELGAGPLAGADPLRAPERPTDDDERVQEIVGHVRELLAREP